jgi:hypothetical protein
MQRFVSYFRCKARQSRPAKRWLCLYKRIKNMPLMNVVVTLIVVGVLLWLVNTYLPMDGKIKSILNVVIVIAVVLWLLNLFGLFSGISTMRVGG